MIAPNTASLRIVALTAGTLRGKELWTLRSLVESGHDLTVIRAERSTDIRKSRRLKRLVRDYGLLHVISRQVGQAVFGKRHERHSRQALAESFGQSELEAWWQSSGVPTIDVPHLNESGARRSMSELNPDLMVRVSGGVIREGTFSIPKIATLNTHHGMAPAIRGMWSIPWGLVSDRPDWIGATIHAIDSGIDTGPVYWRGAPQLAPGDTGEDLFFRIHLEATEALRTLIDIFSKGQTPAVIGYQGESVYRTAPGIWDWMKYSVSGYGQHSPATFERAVAAIPRDQS